MGLYEDNEMGLYEDIIMRIIIIMGICGLIINEVRMSYL